VANRILVKPEAAQKFALVSRQPPTTTFLMLVDEEITSRSGARTKAVGQFGGGLEVRLTLHIGIINDFTRNVIDGRDNNFGMARTGINFAF